MTLLKKLPIFFATRLGGLGKRNYTFRTNGSGSGGGKGGGGGGGLWTLGLLSIIPITTFGLGTWQVQRLRWKVQLIEETEQKLANEPIPLPRILSPDRLFKFEFRRFQVNGRFLHHKEMLVGPRAKDGQNGYYVITPLLISNQDGAILVNRGWIPSEKKNPSTRPESLIDEKVYVEGLLRLGERPGIFIPDNQPDQPHQQWFRIDPGEMARYAGEEYTRPILLEQITTQGSSLNPMLREKGIPIARAPSVELNNPHLQYALTWYSLSVITSVMLLMLTKKRK